MLLHVAALGQALQFMHALPNMVSTARTYAIVLAGLATAASSSTTTPPGSFAAATKALAQASDFSLAAALAAMQKQATSASSFASSKALIVAFLSAFAGVEPPTAAATSTATIVKALSARFNRWPMFLVPSTAARAAYPTQKAALQAAIATGTGSTTTAARIAAVGATPAGMLIALNVRMLVNSTSGAMQAAKDLLAIAKAAAPTACAVTPSSTSLSAYEAAGRAATTCLANTLHIRSSDIFGDATASGAAPAVRAKHGASTETSASSHKATWTVLWVILAVLAACGIAAPLLGAAAKRARRQRVRMRR